MRKMPPHCDTLDGPVVAAAMQSVRNNDVNLILPWVAKEHESELKDAFKKTIVARVHGADAESVADKWFYETAVRLHRKSEGVSFTGVKPAGHDESPAVRLVESALDSKNPSELIGFLQNALREQITRKFDHAMDAKDYDPKDISSAREYIHAFVELTLFCNHVYKEMQSDGHAHE